jgi:predicted Zn finger-like uncharacterized protein
MILTCPECATRYSVPDDRVGAEGRTVRCTSCGLIWRTEREAALELEPAPVEVRPAPAADELPRAFRERIAAQRQGRRAAWSGLVWGGAAAAVLALGLGLVVGRDGVVQAWPKTASAYTALGLPVNSVGLVIEEQSAQVGWEDGRPTVLVTGRLRNVRDRPVTSPPLRFTLLDREEKDLGTRISQVLNADVPAGGSRSFTAKLQNPPESVQNVEIGFHLGAAPAEGGEILAQGSQPTAELRAAHSGSQH